MSGYESYLDEPPPERCEKCGTIKLDGVCRNDKCPAAIAPCDDAEFGMKP